MYSVNILNEFFDKWQIIIFQNIVDSQNALKRAVIYMKKNTRNPFGLVLLCLLGFLAFHTVSAQQSIKGRILSLNDKKPVSFVSIALAQQRRGYTSDKEGNFEIPSKYVGRNDTLVISSIGFKTLKVPVINAISQEEFWLSEESKVLEVVTV